MPPAYAVRAHVVDIRTDTPQATDRILLDTNVWAWKQYFVSGFSASGARIPQTGDYVPYADQLRGYPGSIILPKLLMPEGLSTGISVEGAEPCVRATRRT